MYKVIESFTDLHDMEHEYHAGDTFPRDGINVSAERIKELSSSENKRKMPLIVEIVEEKKATRKRKAKKEEADAG